MLILPKTPCLHYEDTNCMDTDSGLWSSVVLCNFYIKASSAFYAETISIHAHISPICGWIPIMVRGRVHKAWTDPAENSSRCGRHLFTYCKWLLIVDMIATHNIDSCAPTGRKLKFVESPKYFWSEWMREGWAWLGRLRVGEFDWQPGGSGMQAAFIDSVWGGMWLRWEQWQGDAGHTLTVSTKLYFDSNIHAILLTHTTNTI